MHTLEVVLIVTVQQSQNVQAIKNNYSWNLTNETYNEGYDQFYIFEILNGWARVYSSSNNGWIWHERLRVVETF